MFYNCEILELGKEMACDTLVPYYDMGISCGLPNEMGDIPPELMAVPGVLTMGLNVTFVRARGDSMIGVNIHDGDRLMVESTSRFRNQDIVAVKINGEELLKSYYMDEHGRHWLVPSNDRYESILLTEDMDVKFVGRMVWNMQRDVHDSVSNIRQSIERYLNKNGETLAKPQKQLTREDVVKALLSIASQMKKGRHWLGPCRVLMDCGYVPKYRYDLFCDLVLSVLPDHKHLPQEAELRRMAVDCFSKPFKTWSDERAPVHGQHYLGYYNAAVAMLRELPENSLKLP